MRRRARTSPDINMVPYIDVLLVLVLIFMCGAANWVDSISVNLPESARFVQANSHDKVIELTANQHVLIAKKDCGAIKNITAAVLSQHIQKADNITLMASKELPYEKVLQMLVLLQKSGFSKASLAYQPV